MLAPIPQEHLIGQNIMSLISSVVAYYKLDAVSGTRFDSTINASDLSDNNTVTSSVGKIGNAAQFSKVNKEFLSVPTNSFVEMGDIDVTFAVWAKLDSKGTGTRTIFGKTGVLAGQFEYALIFETTLDRWNFFIRSGGVFVNVLANSFGSPSLGVFNFFVCKHDSVNNLISIQIDNGAIDTTAVTAGIEVQNKDFNIGARGEGNPANNVFFDGAIDEMGIYKENLSVSDLDTLFNGGAGLTHPFIVGQRRLIRNVNQDINRDVNILLSNV